MTGWAEGRYGTPPEDGFEQFLCTGDYLMDIVRVCLGCGAVVATNYKVRHLRVCPANVTQATD